MIIHQDQFFALFGNPGPQAGGCYLQDSERRILVALARHVQPCTVIEFGVQDGRTARCILDGFRDIVEYIGIDLPTGSEPALASQNPEVPVAPAAEVRSHSAFHLLLRNSRELVPDDLPLAQMIFIDGGHDYETVKHDTELAFTRIQPSGVIIWHDYNNNPEMGVRRLLDELNQAQGVRIVHVAGTWMALRFCGLADGGIACEARPPDADDSDAFQLSSGTSRMQDPEAVHP